MTTVDEEGGRDKKENEMKERFLLRHLEEVRKGWRIERSRQDGERKRYKEGGSERKVGKGEIR